MPAVPQLTLAFRAGDWLLSVVKPEYNIDSVTIDNSNGTSVLSLPSGYPMKGSNPLISTDTIASQLTSLLLERQNIQPGEAIKCAVLIRGPATITDPTGTGGSNLPTNYVPYLGNGTTGAINTANFKTGILTLTPLGSIVLRTIPVLVTEQTT